MILTNRGGWYLGMVGRFFVETFDPIGSLIYASTLIDHIFLQKKIGLSLSHLVPQIPNASLIFHQNVLFNSF